MKIIKIIPTVLFFQLMALIAFGQNCDCTIQQVESNTVQPCNTTIGTVVNVSTTSELVNAINLANNQGGNMTILIADGTYPVASTSWYPYITASNMVIRSASGNRDAVILTGQGMVDVAPGVEIVLSLQGNNITVADLTLKDVGNHGISLNGDFHVIHNVKIQNTFEQMIKGTSAGDGADDCTVKCCLLEYTAGIGPQWYIGGLDIHEGQNWLVQDNIFRHIKSPSGSLAEFAVHFWNYSSNNTVERNWIVDCDRGVGFGLGSSPNDGGIIRNNMIYNDGNGAFDDVGIGLETSPNTQVYNNSVYIEYMNAIEYRFAATNNVAITNNLTNRPIQSRNGGQAVLTTNYTNALPGMFVDVANGDLRLAASEPLLVDQGTDLSVDVPDDLDKTPRPQGLAFDIGAHEYSTSVGNAELTGNAAEFLLWPTPASERIWIRSENRGTFIITVLNMQGKEMPLKQITLDPGYVQLNLNEWANGLYFCRITQNNGQVEMLRFIVAK